MCNEERELIDFHKDSHQKDGHKNVCKECRNKVKKKENHKNLDKCISRSIYRSFKRNRYGYIWERIIGITFEELKKHLEEQFDDVMTWENYGSYWVIDKIIPTSMYRYSDRVNNEFKKAWSLKNFRPYPKRMHSRKKNKIETIDYYKVYDILPIGVLRGVI